MAQHDYQILNDTGSRVRQDINNVLLAIASNNSGRDAPTNAVPGTLWFDISVTGGPGVLKLYDGEVWNTIAAGIAFLPLAGGNVLGDLTVNGTFSNPDFNKRVVNYLGTTQPFAPATANEGMLWYDTNAPATLKVSTGAAWIPLVDIISPSFTQMVNVEGAAYGVLNLASAGETRRVYSDPTNDRLTFDSLVTSQATMLVHDNGDVWLAGITGNWLGATITSKEPTIGFTPIQQAGASVVRIGASPAPHLMVAGVDQGAIRLGTAVHLFQRGQVGAYTRATSVDPNIAGNGLIAGGWLRYGNDSGPGIEGGTWRNMGSSLGDKEMAVFQRVA